MNLLRIAARLAEASYLEGLTDAQAERARALVHVLRSASDTLDRVTGENARRKRWRALWHDAKARGIPVPSEVEPSGFPAPSAQKKKPRVVEIPQRPRSGPAA